MNQKAVVRTTVYLEEELHTAVRAKATRTGQSVSEIINQAVKCSFAEDRDDLRSFVERDAEPELSFDELLTSLRKRHRS